MHARRSDRSGGVVRERKTACAFATIRRSLERPRATAAPRLAVVAWRDRSAEPNRQSGANQHVAGLFAGREELPRAAGSRTPARGQRLGNCRWWAGVQCAAGRRTRARCSGADNRRPGPLQCRGRGCERAWPGRARDRAGTRANPYSADITDMAKSGGWGGCCRKASTQGVGLCTISAATRFEAREGFWCNWQREQQNFVRVPFCASVAC